MCQDPELLESMLNRCYQNYKLTKQMEQIPLIYLVCASIDPEVAKTYTIVCMWTMDIQLLLM